MISMWSSWCHCHPIISCFIKIQIGLTFLLAQVVLEKRLLNWCLSVCVCLWAFPCWPNWMFLAAVLSCCVHHWLKLSVHAGAFSDSETLLLHCLVHKKTNFWMSIRNTAQWVTAEYHVSNTCTWTCACAVWTSTASIMLQCSSVERWISAHWPPCTGADCWTVSAHAWLWQDAAGKCVVVDVFLIVVCWRLWQQILWWNVWMLTIYIFVSGKPDLWLLVQ